MSSCRATNANAIVAPLAAEFIGAVMDELDARSAA